MQLHLLGCNYQPVGCDSLEPVGATSYQFDALLGDTMTPEERAYLESESRRSRIADVFKTGLSELRKLGEGVLSPSQTPVVATGGNSFVDTSSAAGSSDDNNMAPWIIGGLAVVGALAVVGVATRRKPRRRRRR